MKIRYLTEEQFLFAKALKKQYMDIVQYLMNNNEDGKQWDKIDAYNYVIDDLDCYMKGDENRGLDTSEWKHLL